MGENERSRLKIYIQALPHPPDEMRSDDFEVRNETEEDSQKSRPYDSSTDPTVFIHVNPRIMIWG